MFFFKTHTCRSTFFWYNQNECTGVNVHTPWSQLTANWIRFESKRNKLCCACTHTAAIDYVTMYYSRPFYTPIVCVLKVRANTHLVYRQIYVASVPLSIFFSTRFFAPFAGSYLLQTRKVPTTTSTERCSNIDDDSLQSDTHWIRTNNKKKTTKRKPKTIPLIYPCVCIHVYIIFDSFRRPL